MSLYLSASTATQEQNVANSNDFTVHALRRDKDGMLHYTNARSTEDGENGEAAKDGAGTSPVSASGAPPKKVSALDQILAERRTKVKGQAKKKVRKR